MISAGPVLRADAGMQAAWQGNYGPPTNGYTPYPPSYPPIQTPYHPSGHLQHSYGAFQPEAAVYAVGNCSAASKGLVPLSKAAVTQGASSNERMT